MSTESPQITICLPVYNASSFIEAALDSILNQSYGNFELLVADDGSTDNTIEILRKYARKIQGSFSGKTKRTWEPSATTTIASKRLGGTS